MLLGTQQPQPRRLPALTRANEVIVSSFAASPLPAHAVRKAGDEGQAGGSALRVWGPGRLLPPCHLWQPVGLVPSGVSCRVTAAVARPCHLPAVAVGAVSGGRSNLGWEREDAGLMIAFDFVILAVIALSGNLKDSVWKCSQIITVIQKEGKIVFLLVRMESTIKNTPEPPSPFLWVGPDPARPRGTPCSC